MKNTMKKAMSALLYSSTALAFLGMAQPAAAQSRPPSPGGGGPGSGVIQVYMLNTTTAVNQQCPWDPTYPGDLCSSGTIKGVITANGNIIYTYSKNWVDEYWGNGSGQPVCYNAYASLPYLETAHEVLVDLITVLENDGDIPLPPIAGPNPSNPNGDGGPHWPDSNTFVCTASGS